MEVKAKLSATALEQYFKPFRNNILGIDQTFESPYGTQKMVYTDWTASGRLYTPIEEKMLQDFGPFVANTHTQTTVSGTTMTHAYHKARQIIKEHVNAGPDDVLITTGTERNHTISKAIDPLEAYTSGPSHSNLTVLPGVVAAFLMLGSPN